MKKSTLIVVLVAIALAAFVYFYDSKQTPKASASDMPKSAFTITPGNLSNIRIERKDQTIALTKTGSSWELTAPVVGKADQSTVEGIADDLGDLQIQRSFATGGDLSKYGLSNPAATIEFQDTKGARHTIQLGDKDFSGNDIYALIDKANPPKVDLLPVSLLDDANKSVRDLRDRSLINLNGSQITALSITDPSGSISVKKVNMGWEITQPRSVPADPEAVDSLVSSLSTSKFSDVASETLTHLAKYGLAHPSVSLDATTKNGKQLRLLLSKKGADYYGRDLQRPIIFTVDSAIYDSFDKKFFDLRDKEILQHFDPTGLATVQVRNSNGLVECKQGKIDEWTMLQPVKDKGKSVQGWRLTDPIQNARATQIYDSPSAALLAHLKKPAIQLLFTDKSGKTTTIQISAAVGKSVYVRTSAGPQVYELNTQILHDLGFKASDLLI